MGCFRVFYHRKAKRGKSQTHMSRRTFKTKSSGRNWARKRGLSYFRVTKP